MVKGFIYKGVALSTLLLFSACGGDNAYDGKNGLRGGSSVASETSKNVIASIQKNVLLVDAEQLLADANDFETKLQAFDINVSVEKLDNLKDAFEAMMKSWKSVQSTYVIKDFNKDLYDNPQLMDFYRTGKKLDVASDLDRALSRDNAIINYMRKSSNVSITGLEYLLYGHRTSSADMISLMNLKSKRRIEAMKLVIANLKSLIEPIVEFYKTDTKLVSDVKEASNSLVNVLIDVTYRLREFRVGEPAGLVVKFKDEPNPERFEYYKSGLSTEAIKSILEAQSKIMGSQGYSNFGTLATSNGASDVVTKINGLIAEAMSIVNGFDKPIEEYVTTTGYDPKIKKLYDLLTELQSVYYESLIEALSLTAKIIEADGD